MSGVSIFIASSTSSGRRASTRSPAATSTLITVPGIGAVTLLSPPRAARPCAALSTSGGGAGGAVGRFSRQPPRQGASGRRSGGSESGGCSVRNAVVASPARSDGMRDEPAEERQVRRHAADLGLRERVREPGERLGARRPVRDQLRDHRVVAEPDLVALLDARVDADARRQAQPLDPSRPGGGTCADPRRRAAPRPRGRDFVFL